MSDGATMSAPAHACESAVLARSPSEGSFCTLPSRTIPQCPWEVYSHRHTSVMTRAPGKRLLLSRTARCTIPFSS